MKTIKFGIVGMRRGYSCLDYFLQNNGELVALCDTDTDQLQTARARVGDQVGLYDNFDAFLAHPGLEAVYLANNFHEHAPMAIRCLEKGIHVLSECLSNGTMAEGVALIRAAEKSGAVYMLDENYPYMLFNQEMKRLYDEGTLGRVLFAEGEYNHPVNGADIGAVRALRPHLTHWRNYLPRTYYITHALAPLMYITGATPRRVEALPIFAPPEGDYYAGCHVGDISAIILCQNDDDSVFRVSGCSGYGAHENSYRVCCTKGQVENVRGTDGKIMLRYNDWEIPQGRSADNFYTPEWKDPDRELIQKAGHGGGDFCAIREFFRCIREGERPMFDVYFATTTASVGILAHRSVLSGGMPYDIPDFHNESDRVKYENDHQTPFYSGGREPNIPCCSRPDFRRTEEELARYQALLEQ